MICKHGIHMDNACGACEPPRSTTIRNSAEHAQRRPVHVMELVRFFPNPADAGPFPSGVTGTLKEQP